MGEDNTEQTEVDTSSKESLPKADKYEENIREAIGIFETNMNETSGFFPATDKGLDTPEAKENEMQKSWVRDQAFDLLGLIESQKHLREAEPDNPLIPKIRALARSSITKNLETWNQPRWIDGFNQEIVEDGEHTFLTRQPPEVHTEHNGDSTGHHWDHNQPEAWGDYLLMLGEARKDGIMPAFTTEQLDLIHTMTDYLFRIKPWKFKGSGVWEGSENPVQPSRSMVLAIAKGLDAILPVFVDDQNFSQQIDQTIDKSMEYVLKDINDDKTDPREDVHPKGADLAMIMVMALPGSERTRMPFLKYIEDNLIELQMNSLLPGIIRYLGDVYYRVSFGEARWPLGDMALASGYFNEAELAEQRDDFKLVDEYKDKAFKRMENVEKVKEKFHYIPELLMQHDPTHMEGRDDVMKEYDGHRMVTLEPLKRSLLWNVAFMANLSAQAKRFKNLEHIKTEQLVAA